MPFAHALLMLAALAGAPAAAGAAEGWFTLSTGVVIRLPAIAQLDCAAKKAVLDAIDRTGYRRGQPTPPNAADMALLDYEDRLSRSYYTDCVRNEVMRHAPGAAFTGDAPGSRR